jgi:hypothetical protein
LVSPLLKSTSWKQRKFICMIFCAYDFFVGN